MYFSEKYTHTMHNMTPTRSVAGILFKRRPSDRLSRTPSTLILFLKDIRKIRRRPNLTQGAPPPPLGTGLITLQLQKVEEATGFKKKIAQKMFDLFKSNFILIDKKH